MCSYEEQALAWRQHVRTSDGYILARRTFNCLFWMCCERGIPIEPGAVAALKASDLMRQDNMGKVSLQDVRNWLAYHDFRLLLDTPSYPPSRSDRLLAEALDVLHAA